MDQANRKSRRSEGRRALGGLLILTGLVAAAVLIISLDELLATRVPTVDLHAELPQTEGLAAGAPVWIAGNEVGTVLSVSLQPPDVDGGSRIVAVARIPREHFALLRQDSRAHVKRPGFVGDPLLELSPGTAAAAPIGPGDTIRAEFGPDRFAEAIVDARSLLVEVDTLLGQLRHVGALYRERRPMLDQLARSLALASTELERTSSAVRAGPLAAALGDAQLAARFGRVRASLTTLRQGLGRYTAGPLTARLDALATRADSLGADLAALDSLTSSPHAFVGRARADSALAVEAARTRAQLDSLAEAVKSNPMMFF